MKTTLRILRSISGKTEISFYFPMSWKQMTQEELRLVLDTLAGAKDKTTARVRCILRMNRVHVIRRWDDGWLCFSWRSWRKKRFFVIYPWQMAWMEEQLNWMDEFSTMQNRLEKAAGGDAVDMTLHDVSFGDYLQLEKWYQMYLRTKKEDFIVKMAHHLYLKDGKPTKRKMTPGEVLGTMLWWVYVKEVFARAFPHFFRKTNGVEEEDDAFRENIVRQMNIQIRALTEGDVTKEHIILEKIDCWRALTELNEKAREAKEREKQLSKMKK